MKKQKLISQIKPVVIIMLVCVVVLVCMSLGKSLKHSGYFTVKNIVVNEHLQELSSLRGCNIFSVNLSKVSGYLLAKYPDYRQIRLIRILPDKLFIYFSRRVPVARVKLYREFYVDKDAVLFNIGSVEDVREVPRLTGFDSIIFGPKAGKKYPLKPLEEALNIIKEFSLNKSLQEYRINRIDLAHNRNLILYLSLQDPSLLLEVRLGQDSIKDKINILGSVLWQAKADSLNIKYIDLRFKEPVIKFADPDRTKARKN